MGRDVCMFIQLHHKAWLMLGWSIYKTGLNKTYLTVGASLLEYYIQLNVRD